MHCNIHGRHMPEIERTYAEARRMLDFFPIAYYPFYFYKTPEGLSVETWRQRERFLQDWDRIAQVAAQFDEPGRFVTFMGYEWHGNRTYYGDHNVFYYDGGPLDPTEDLPELLENLRRHNGIAIPHHTAYQVHDRGKDWDYHDNQLCPFTEIYSNHGSSEACNTPYTLNPNGSMSPRVTAGTAQAGLARGYRLGIICSGDSHGGMAGVWGSGLVGVWATELTRGALWEAFLARRVYGVTGDRIRLDFSANGLPMGAEGSAAAPVEIATSVVASQALDRIELLRNNRVIATHCHNGAWQPPTTGTMRAKIKLEFGWGPVRSYGFNVGPKQWEGRVRLSEGRIAGVEGCFTRWGQRVESSSDRELAFKLETDQRRSAAAGACQQAFILELEAPVEATLDLEVDGRQETITLGDALAASRVFAFKDQARDLVRRVFSRDPDTIENPDVFYHNAYKVKVHTAIPEAGYRADWTFTDEKPPAGRNVYYVRVSQLNGQMAWSSPIWIEVGR